MTGKLLIDSHVLIWLLYEPHRIGPDAQALIKNASVCLSVTSLWELAIKFSSGKLDYSPEELSKGVKALEIELLSLDVAYLEVLPNIKLDQGDPFDRLLIAQCEAEDMTLLTVDKSLLNSPYRTSDVRQ